MTSRAPLNQMHKPKFPDPLPESSSAPVTNILMAIDPTYPRRGGGGLVQSPLSSYDTSSGTVTTSTSSSSAGFVMPSPESGENDDSTSPVPPYMPIQGQRRTASLEKKAKKKGKDSGCKQQ